MTSKDARNLTKRYLIWFHKVVKDELDRIERKFTQLEVDRLILAELKKHGKDAAVRSRIDEFAAYIAQKQRDGLALKFDGSRLKPDVAFLHLKLAAIEKVIAKQFGKKVLGEVKDAYEAEMTERIMKSTEHK